MSRPQTSQDLRTVHPRHPLPGENDGDSVVVVVHRRQVVQHVGCRTPGRDLVGAPVPARDIGDKQLKAGGVVVNDDDLGLESLVGPTRPLVATTDSTLSDSTGPGAGHRFDRTLVAVETWPSDVRPPL
jgi:hypothetical protein